ncbi:MAG: chemotaxis protein CheX [bacterium]
MVPKFFGQYLLEKEVLSRDQLIEAINYQRLKVLKLGEIALAKGYLTEKEVAKIHNEQRRTDKMFGELAVGMDLLTEAQLKQILTIQQNSHIYLGEAIVALGFLDNARLEKELTSFKENQKVLPPIEVMIAEDVEHKDVMIAVVDITSKMLRRVADLLSKTGQLRYEDKAIKNLGVASYIELKGNLINRIILNCTWDVAHHIARKTFKNESLPFDQELIIDTTAEFINIICGNVRAKLLENGRIFEINPPNTFPDNKQADIKLDNREQAVIVPAYTPTGELEVGLITKT